MAHIIDGRALLAVPALVRPDKIGEVFQVLSERVAEKSLLVTRSTVDVLRRLDPNGHACVWVDSVMAMKQHIRIDWSWQLEAQATAQQQGYTEGLEDTLTERPSGMVEIVGLILWEIHCDRPPIAVTEDRSEMPLRPALEPFCKLMGWTTMAMREFLESQGLDSCLL